MHKLLRAAALIAAVPLLGAANSRPQPLPLAETIPAARDIAYPGVRRPPGECRSHRHAAGCLRLFGARHFDHYDFLLAMTDRMGGIGLEHHRSSENQNEPTYFTDFAGNLSDHNLLPHEFVHSWNGKFRRGADLWTPDFRTPMRNSLLWVCEG